MIRDDMAGQRVELADEWSESVALDPRDVTWSSEGWFVELEFPERDATVWLRKEMILSLQVALSDALQNIEEMERK